MLKIGLLGYGKMGKTIEKLVTKSKAEIAWRIHSRNAQCLTEELIKKADVVIEFSHPEAGFSNIMSCLEAGIPVVSGTTGWLDRYEEAVAFCKEKKGAMLYASNFSLGVNLFFTLNKHLAKLMEPWSEYKADVSEIHHIHKKDAPSGTAITLAEGIIANHAAYATWQLSNDKQAENGLEITAFREEEVPGTHNITWKSPLDEIRIEHVAHSREGFASGALMAAHWIYGKEGVFGMEDVLKIE